VSVEAKKCSILVVDDEVAILFAFKDILSEPGISVDTAQSIEEATDLLTVNHYEGAVVDLRLGGSNGTEGFEVIRLIKKQNPRCKVVMLTAFAQSEIRERAFNEGADFFKEKPVSPEEIRTLFASSGIL